MESKIREYFDDYIKYYPEKWEWTLKNTENNFEKYRQYRARRCSVNPYEDTDKRPFFDSIEKDAEQFDLCEVEWTDFFGIEWQGKKGKFARAGSPNYKGSLYYFGYDEYERENEYLISEDYDAYENQPPKDIYLKIEDSGRHRWIDVANVERIQYKYIVTNHLFKDTHIILKYPDGEKIRVFACYGELIHALLEHGKDDLVKNVIDTMNEHFIKLRDSNREEEREFYPGKTAEEMFLIV